MSDKWNDFVAAAQSNDVNSMQNLMANQSSFDGLYPSLQTSVNNWQGNVDKMPGDNLYDKVAISKASGNLAYTKTGIPYDRSNIDSMINALSQEYAYKRDDESYDRLFTALKRNGVNPALVLSNASALSSDVPYRSNYNLNAKDQVNSALKVGAILTLLFKLLK